MRSAWSFIWRGALGGAAGCLLLVLHSVLYFQSTTGHIPYGLFLFLIGTVPLSIFLGLIDGTVLGAIIWGLSAKTGKCPGPVSRSLIGAVFAALLGVVIRIFSQDKVSKSWTNTTLHFLEWTIVLGILPAVLAGIACKNGETAQ